MEEGKSRCLERSLVSSVALLQPGHPNSPPLSLMLAIPPTATTKPCASDLARSKSHGKQREDSVLPRVP